MSLPEDRKRRWHYHTFSFRKENLTKGEDDMDSNAFLNDLMSKMKLSEAKGKKKAEQSESVAQILAVMQKVKTEKKKPPVTSYAPVKEMPMNEPESMEEFSQLASDVMRQCRRCQQQAKRRLFGSPHISVFPPPIRHRKIRMKCRNATLCHSWQEMQGGHPPAFIPIMAFPQQAGKDGQVSTVCSDTASRGKLTV